MTWRTGSSRSQRTATYGRRSMTAGKSSSPLSAACSSQMEKAWRSTDRWGCAARLPDTRKPGSLAGLWTYGTCFKLRGPKCSKVNPPPHYEGVLQDRRVVCRCWASGATGGHLSHLSRTHRRVEQCGGILHGPGVHSLIVPGYAPAVACSCAVGHCQPLPGTLPRVPPMPG